MENDHRVFLGCGCGKAPGAPAQPDPQPVVTTGIEGETGAAQ